MPRTLATLILVGLIAFTASARAEDVWPQFRGPDGQGHTTVANLPLKFSDSQNVRWKTPIVGTGWSSPVGRGDRIWLTTASDEGRSLRLVGLDSRLGKVVVDREIFHIDTPVYKNDKNSHASPSPVLDGDKLYVHFGTMGTACYDIAGDKVVWTNRDQQINHKEGPGSSPIVYRDLLIFHCDGIDKQYVVALNKQTGAVVWKTTRSGKMNSDPDQRKAYCTPLIVRHGERDLLISPTADRVFAYDPLTGGEIWHVEYTGYSNVPRPVFGEGLVYVCTGYNKPSLIAIDPTGEGDLTKQIRWTVKSQIPANPSPIFVDGLIYTVSDQGVACCFDATTGKELWKKRLGGNFSASPLAAPGKIYFLNEQGEVTVIKPGKKFEELAKNTLDARLMASPAVIDGALVLRTETHLYRFHGETSPTTAAK